MFNYIFIHRMRIDGYGPHVLDTDDVNLVEVPPIPCPLSEEAYHILLSTINPLAESDSYAEDLYVRVLEFVTMHQAI